MSGADLASGKLPAALLRDLLATDEPSSPELLLPPRAGEDAGVIALADGALPEASVRHLIVDSDGVVYAFEGLSEARDPGPHLPDAVLNRLNDILRGQLAQFRSPVIESRHAHVPIELDGDAIGAFAAWTPTHRTLDDTDAVVMRILAGQTAVALRSAHVGARLGDARAGETLARLSGELD